MAYSPLLFTPFTTKLLELRNAHTIIGNNISMHIQNTHSSNHTQTNVYIYTHKFEILFHRVYCYFPLQIRNYYLQIKSYFSQFCYKINDICPQGSENSVSVLDLISNFSYFVQLLYKFDCKFIEGQIVWVHIIFHYD